MKRGLYLPLVYIVVKHFSRMLGCPIIFPLQPSHALFFFISSCHAPDVFWQDCDEDEGSCLECWWPSGVHINPLRDVDNTDISLFFTLHLCDTLMSWVIFSFSMTKYIISLHHLTGAIYPAPLLPSFPPLHFTHFIPSLVSMAIKLNSNTVKITICVYSKQTLWGKPVCSTLNVCSFVVVWCLSLT